MVEQEIDYVLIPMGLILMVSYHIWLLYRVVCHPTTTVVGINAINRNIWVRCMMQDPVKNGVLAVQTIRNNIMASTLLASTAITLSSLIAVLMTSGGAGNGRGFVVGDQSGGTLRSVKFLAILVCFLVAFLLNVQSIRYYSHASVLINVPHKGRSRLGRDPGAEYVGRALNRGGYFWSLGLRAFYFSIPMFLWIFGPIPMLVCCVLMVFLLYFLDVNSELGERVEGDEEEDDEECRSVEVVNGRC